MSLKCEIQVRTALQNSWAIISHHLVYKKESEISVPLRRRINSLAGLLETPDDQFERLRQDRDEYLEHLRAPSAHDDQLLAQGIDVDSVRVFLEKRFPDFPVEGRPGALGIVLSDLNRERYKTVGDLSALLGRTEDARRAYYDEPSRQNKSSAGQLAVALALEDPSHREFGWDSEQRSLFKRHEHLVRREV